jgi:hypothetical protein
MAEGLPIALVIGFLISLRASVLALCVVVFFSVAVHAGVGMMVGIELWRTAVWIIGIAVALQFGYLLGRLVQMLLQTHRCDAEMPEL